MADPWAEFRTPPTGTSPAPLEATGDPWAAFRSAPEATPPPTTTAPSGPDPWADFRPKPPEATSPGITGYGKELGKAVLRGGAEALVAEPLRGFGAHVAAPSPWDVALRLAAQGPNANPEIQRLAAEERYRPPPAEQPLYQAGEATSKAVLSGAAIEATS